MFGINLKIILAAFALAAGLLSFGLWERGSLKKAEANLTATQKELAVTKENYTDCQKNVTALVEQYAGGEKITQKTIELKKKIIALREKQPLTKKPVQQSKPDANVANQVPAPPIVVQQKIKEDIDNEDKEYLGSVIDVSNLLFAQFNGLLPKADSGK
jgi:cell division protein FtsB